MTTKSRSNAPDVTVLLVAEGEPFAEALATQLEALSVQVELLTSADNITDAFIVPPQLVALAAAAAPDGGASVLAQLAKRAATSGVAVAVIGEAASGASTIDPSASPEDMAAQIAKLASERRGSRARIPLPSPGVERSVVERSVIERPRLPPTPRAPLPRAPVAPSSEAKSSERSSDASSSEAKPPLPLAKPMPRPGGAKPFAKTLQLTAVRPPASAAASAFASRPPAPVASAPAKPPAPPAPLRPAIATPSTPSSSAVSSSAVSSSAVSSSAVSSSAGGASPSAPSATSPIPPSPMTPSTAATPLPLSSTPQPTQRTSADPPVAPIAAAPLAAPPPAPGRARMRHATLVGLPSPVAVIARDAQPVVVARDAQPTAASQPSEEPKPDVATTLVGHPAPALDDVAPDVPTPTDVALPAEPDDAPATVRPPAPPDDALEATDMGIELPEHPSEPPIAGEATDAGIPLPDDLSTPPVETSDFAIAFDHQPVVHTPTGDVPAPTDLPGEPTPILKMAPYTPSAPSHEHPAAPPPPARSRWPLALAAVVLLGGGVAGGAWFWSQRPTEPIVTSVAPSVVLTATPTPPEVGAAAPAVPTEPTPTAVEVAPIEAAPTDVATEAAPTEAAPAEGAPTEATPTEATPTEAASPPPAPVGGVRLPIGAGDPIEGTDAEFDLARLGITPIVDPGGRRTTRRRIDRLLAQAYRARSRSRLDDSEEAYREVLALDPVNARALVGLSLVNADRDDHATAALFARRLVRLHPTAPANLVLLGDRYAAGGDVAAARRCYERALSIDRRHRGARAALAGLHAD